MINQHSVLPVYYQVKNDLQTRIKDREFLPGARLPSESMLSQHYQVSRQAMRHALGELASQGVIRPRQGVGWFVNGPRLVKPLPVLSSYTAQMAALSPDSDVKVISQEQLPASPEVAEALAIESSEPVIRIERLGAIAHEPVTLLTAYLPADICPGLINAPLDDTSVYAYLNDECGVRFVRASSRLEVVFADPKQAGLLQVKEGHPLIRLEGTSFTEAGRAGEFTSLEYVHERFQFTIESYRDEATQRTLIAAR
jgi:GntR family transcriptional regulator